MNRLFTAPLWVLVLFAAHGLFLGMNIMGMISPYASPAANIVRLIGIISSVVFLVWAYAKASETAVEDD